MALRRSRIDSGGLFVSALGLPQVLDTMEAIPRLKLLKPSRAGGEIRNGASLLLLQEVEALPGFPLSVFKRDVQTRLLLLIHPCYDHLLHLYHGGLARHLHHLTSCLCLYCSGDLVLVLPDGP